MTYENGLDNTPLILRFLLRHDYIDIFNSRYTHEEEWISVFFFSFSIQFDHTSSIITLEEKLRLFLLISYSLLPDLIYAITGPNYLRGTLNKDHRYYNFPCTSKIARPKIFQECRIKSKPQIVRILYYNI